jgi:2-alkenal reductase
MAEPVAAAELDANDIVAAQEQVMINIYQDLLPSVVHIRVSSRLDTGSLSPSNPRIPPAQDPRDFFQQGEGSGFIWDDDGHIVTNNHVIQDADRVIVTFADRVQIEAKVIGTDPDSDLAVLELVEKKEGSRPVTLGDSDTLQVGQMAVAIGNPFGQQFTMTTGIVSALGRTINSSNSAFSIPEVVQTDAPINPGNSGGPLLDRFGRVIAINTQIISRSGVSSGVGFAVPISIAKRVIPALIEDGHYDYSWLGITGSSLRSEIAVNMDLPKNTGGALIIQVSGDSPADDAGLKGSGESFIIDGIEFPSGGDIIVAIDGETITRMADLIAYLVSNTQPGDKVVMEVIRSDEGRIELDVTLGKRPNTG